MILQSKWNEYSLSHPLWLQNSTLSFSLSLNSNLNDLFWCMLSFISHSTTITQASYVWLGLHSEGKRDVHVSLEMDLGMGMFGPCKSLSSLFSSTPLNHIHKFTFQGTPLHDSIIYFCRMTEKAQLREIWWQPIVLDQSVCRGGFPNIPLKCLCLEQELDWNNTPNSIQSQER